jgi:hypothetical protein
MSHDTTIYGSKDINKAKYLRSQRRAGFNNDVDDEDFYSIYNNNKNNEY